MHYCIGIKEWRVRLIIYRVGLFTLRKLIQIPISYTLLKIHVDKTGLLSRWTTKQYMYLFRLFLQNIGCWHIFRLISFNVVILIWHYLIFLIYNNNLIFIWEYKKVPLLLLPGDLWELQARLHGKGRRVPNIPRISRQQFSF